MKVHFMPDKLPGERFGGRQVGKSLWHATQLNLHIGMDFAQGKDKCAVAFASAEGMWVLQVEPGTKFHSINVRDEIVLRTPEGMLVRYRAKRA